jgi:hypothetical protein
MGDIQVNAMYYSQRHSSSGDYKDFGVMVGAFYKTVPRQSSPEVTLVLLRVKDNLKKKRHTHQAEVLNAFPSMLQK